MEDEQVRWDLTCVKNILDYFYQVIQSEIVQTV